MVRKPGLMQSSNLLSILQTAGGIIVGTLSLVGATLVAMAVALFIVERAAPGKRPVMRRGCCAGIKDSAILMGLLFTGMQTRLPSGPLSRPVAACCAMSSTLMAVIQTALLTVALQTTSRTQSVSSLADLRGKTVVVPKATTAMDFLYANSVGQRVLQVDAIGTALDLFKAGKGDAVVYDMPILTAFIAGQTLERGVAEYELVGDLMHREQYGIAMHKGLPAQELHAFNSAVLSAYGTPEVAALGERWLLFPHRSANQLTDSIELESTTGLFESNFVLITEIVAIIVGMALLGGAFVFCYRWVLLARSGGCSSEGVREWLVRRCLGHSSESEARIRRRRQPLTGREGSRGSVAGQNPDVPQVASTWACCAPCARCCAAASAADAVQRPRPPRTSVRISQSRSATVVPSPCGVQTEVQQQGKVASVSEPQAADSTRASSRGGWIHSPPPRPAGAAGILKARKPSQWSEDAADGLASDPAAPSRRIAQPGTCHVHASPERFRSPLVARRLQGHTASPAWCSSEAGSPHPAGHRELLRVRRKETRTPADPWRLVDQARLGGPQSPVAEAGEALQVITTSWTAHDADSDDECGGIPGADSQKQPALPNKQRAGSRLPTSDNSLLPVLTSGLGHDAPASRSREGCDDDDEDDNPMSPRLATRLAGPAAGGRSPALRKGRHLSKLAVSAEPDSQPLTKERRRSQSADRRTRRRFGIRADGAPLSSRTGSVYGSVTKSARCGGPASHSSARSGIRPSRQLAHLAELAVMDSVLGGPGSTSRYDDGDEPDPVEARADQPAEVSADGSGGHSRHAAPPGGPANALELHPAFGADAEERMALKREQWGMRVEGRVAPILQPLDLMWLIWERVDMIAQQSLLQRAMGRLDVPLDLEGVPAQIIEDESLLLSEELKARGMPPPLAQRAAIAATLAGIRDDASVSSGSSDVSTPTASQIADDNMSMPVPAAVGNGRGRASSAVKQATAPNVALALARLRRNAAAAAREEPESDEQAYLAAPSGAEKSPRRRAPRPRGGSRLASLAMTFAASWSATPAGDSAVTNDSPTASPT